MPRLPWNEEQLLCLCHYAYQKKPYIAKRNEIIDKWITINDLFFNSPVMEDYREVHFNKSDFRKIRVKFEETIKDVQKNIESGNQSGKEGDISELYNLIRMINEEIALNNEEKAREAQTKERIEQNTDTILPSDRRNFAPIVGYGKRKSLDGSITTTSQTK